MLWGLHSAPCSGLPAQGTGYPENSSFYYWTEGKKEVGVGGFFQRQVVGRERVVSPSVGEVWIGY